MQCANCGHIHIGEKATAICPACEQQKVYFQIVAKNCWYYAGFLFTDFCVITNKQVMLKMRNGD